MKITELKERIISSIIMLKVPYKKSKESFFWCNDIVFEREAINNAISNALHSVLWDIEKELNKYDEIKKLENELARDKLSIVKEKELFYIEKEHTEKALKVKYELSIDDIKNNLKLNNNEQAVALWNALLQIESLKEQISFYKEQNNNYKEMMKDWFKANNEALIKVAESKNNIIVK